MPYTVEQRRELTRVAAEAMYAAAGEGVDELERAGLPTPEAYAVVFGAAQRALVQLAEEMLEPGGRRFKPATKAALIDAIRELIRGAGAKDKTEAIA